MFRFGYLNVFSTKKNEELLREMADVKAGSGKVKDEHEICCYGRKEVVKKWPGGEGLWKGVICQKTLEPAWWGSHWRNLGKFRNKNNDSNECKHWLN